jgi:hypothetical protein
LQKGDNLAEICSRSSARVCPERDTKIWDGFFCWVGVRPPESARSNGPYRVFPIYTSLASDRSPPVITTFVPPAIEPPRGVIVSITGVLQKVCNVAHVVAIGGNREMRSLTTPA